MHKITMPQISVFLVLLTLAITLGVTTSYELLGGLPLGDFRGVVLTVTGVLFIYLWGAVVYRGFLYVMPLGEGEIAEGSREAFAAQVHFLFFLLMFNSVVRTHVIPVPIMRLVYLALGARLGPNTYISGVMLDPILAEFGANCVVGHDAALFSHVIEGSRLALYPIRVGDGVTIGATAVVMPDVSIGDGAIVAVGAVVSKGTTIGPHEVWGGVPARRLN